MNEQPTEKEPTPLSIIQMDIRIEESWIALYLEKEQLTLPISDKYELNQLSFSFAQGQLILEGELKEKPGSILKMSCVPVWDAETQRLHIHDLEVRTRSKNIWVKSAGWFAQAFLQEKIDGKVEQAAHRLYAHYLELLLSRTLDMPVPMGGAAKVSVTSVVIHEMVFLDKALEVKATLEGTWHLHLFDNEIPTDSES